MQKTALPRVESGDLVALRLFDVAHAIDLAKVEEIATDLAPTSVARIRLTRADPKAIAFGVPPVEIGLRPIELELGGVWRMLDASARIYDFGVVSLALRLPVEDLDWEEFVTLACDLDDAVSGPGAAQLWPDLVSWVREQITPAIERPVPAGLMEDYLLSTVRSFDEPLTAEELLARVDLVPLLSGEREPLSDAARRDLLRHSYSYYRTDLAVLTWDNAFIYEPSGDTDVADVLEVANAQLLELRYFDELLDDELPRMYERVAAARRAIRGLFPRQYADLARDLHALVAEVTEVTEKVDNALKVTEDVYLARIYAAALDLFRVKNWAGAVDRKLAIIRETYTALYDEAATIRAETLEFAIVVLIILEIILAFVI